MFDDNPGAEGSPVIGFAADGFPIYGSYFLDPQTNQVRKAISGYELKAGTRPGPDDDDPEVPMTAPILTTMNLPEVVI